MALKNWIQFEKHYFPKFPSLQEDVGKHFEARRDMKTRADDVLLVTFPKCGTHWVWEIIGMLLKGKAEYQPLAREHLFLDSVEPSSLDSLPSPRVFSTHLPFRWLPQEHFRSGRKAVNVIRNPKDTAVSLYCQLRSSGGDLVNISWSEFFDEVVVGEYSIYGGYFGFQKELYRALQSNKGYSLHTMYYENLKKDPVPEILKLADYLGVTCTGEVAADIANKCSFHNLKHASDTIKDHGEIKRLMKEWGLELPKFYRKESHSSAAIPEEE
ncbi:sulfotransferase 6B1-like isoform X2 [Ostrea edulis]|uniref:sulfotransferase 6B1-like isoform X2 n=1 Tax=Ostrea edulis TaxID=37623 RepID=UPI0024AF56AD|nr:sulfotransferase 6B1-like isoform X2 [Ostrea edulis]